MRIISGEFRGRRLKGPRGRELRPTSDRLKETLFDILGPTVRGTVFVDVFAGTGSIGLEALSRGAREVVFIESSRTAVDLIRRNLELCRVVSGYRLMELDVFAALRTLLREGFGADIAYADPPYRWEPYGDLLAIFFRRGLARPNARVILEHHCKTALPEAGEGYGRTRTVRQRDKCLSFYAPTDRS